MINDVAAGSDHYDTAASPINNFNNLFDKDLRGSIPQLYEALRRPMQ
jgi:hypothetical protein